MIVQEWYRSQAMYSAVMKLLQDGKIKEVMSLIGSIPLQEVRLKALSNLIVTLARNGEDIRDFLGMFYSTALSLNHEDSGKAFLSLALSLIEEGFVEEALDVARHVPDVSIGSKIKAEVAIKLAKRGEIERAMKLMGTSSMKTLKHGPCQCWLQSSDLLTISSSKHF